MTNAWVSIGTYSLPVFGHVDLIGNTLGTYTSGASTLGYYLFEVTSDNIISVFETNWLETGSYGTSDIATYISSSEDGTGAGQLFSGLYGAARNPALQMESRPAMWLCRPANLR